MDFVIAAGAPGMWTALSDHLWVLRTRIEEMAAGIEPVHYALIALGALIVWGLMGRRH